MIVQATRFELWYAGSIDVIIISTFVHYSHRLAGLSDGLGLRDACSVNVVVITAIEYL